MGRENKVSGEYEIDLLELLQIIWSDRRTVIKYSIVFSLIGLFVAVFSPKEYTASTTVLPQTSGSRIGGNIGGLAAIAGINLGGGLSSSESIPPNLYPKIVQSLPFKRKLLRVPLKISNVDKEVTYQEYYEKHQKVNVLSIVKDYTIGLPSKIIGFFKGKPQKLKEVNDSIYRVSLEEMKLFDQLQKQLSINHNKEQGFVQISFSMPESLPAAQMTKKAQDLLQKSITDFKIQKVQEEYEFISQRYKELKIEFIKKQTALARFKDRNQGLVLSRSQSQLERLQSEYELTFNLYSELAKQFEAQKIKLKENTPVFTIINPVSVPVNKSKPKRIMILLVWMFLGTIAGMLFVLVKNWLIKSK